MLARPARAPPRLRARPGAPAAPVRPATGRPPCLRARRTTARIRIIMRSYVTAGRVRPRALFARQAAALLALVIGLGCTGSPATPPPTAAPSVARESVAPAGPTATPERVSLTVAYGTLSGNTAPIWLGQDHGLYAAEGLDVELV